jgi:hypothetical protein
MVLVFRKEIQLNSSDGSAYTFVWGNLPVDMRSSLEHNIRSALIVEGGNPLVETDSAAAPDGHTFPAIHFDYYARNGTLVSLFNMHFCCSLNT